MIPLILKKKDSHKEISYVTWRLNDKQRSKYFPKTKKIFKRRMQVSNRPLKRSLMKINLWWKEFIPYPVSWILQQYQYSFYHYLSNFTCYYRFLWRRRRSCFLRIISTKRKRSFEKMVKQVSRCPQKTYW